MVEFILRNRLGLEGRAVLAATRFRRGQSQVMQGTTIRPCDNVGTFAWLDPNRGPNDRYVFVCDRALSDFPPQTVSLFLIHESLHVAGQLEDLNSTVGPGNPPNSGQIQNSVIEACEAPQMLPVEN